MSSEFPPVRPARRNDGPPLRRVQSHLSEPSPQLLSAALAELSADTVEPTGFLRAWRLLVSPDSDDRPVGYLLATTGESTHIAELAVDPAYRRENRATALLETLCDDVTAPVTVHVAATNKPARSLYRRVGFVQSGRLTEQFDSSDGLALQYDPEN